MVAAMASMLIFICVFVICYVVAGSMLHNFEPVERWMVTFLVTFLYWVIMMGIIV